MGDIFIDLTVVNVNDPEKQQEVTFLVDTGASRAWLPEEIVHRLGILHEGTISVELADSSQRELAYGFCLFDFGGERVAGNIIFGPAGSEPIAGTHVLQDFRLSIDLDHHRIIRNCALRAK